MKLLLIITLSLFSYLSHGLDYKNVALISASSAYDEASLPFIIESLTKKGYDVTDKYLEEFPSDLGYSADDEVRANLLMDAMQDDNIDIIWFVKGGAGALNLLPILKKNLSQLKTLPPKVMVGFSDVTAIHSFINKYLGWKSIHGVVAEFNKDVYGLKLKNNVVSSEINKLEPLPSIKEIMTKGVNYQQVISLSKKASISGKLIGGNLTLVESTLATPFQPNFKNKILLLEDTGDSYRHLDRSLNHLLMVKNIREVEAVFFGQFYSLKATDEERLIYKKVLENFMLKLNKPVFYFPVFGHGVQNKPFIFNELATVKCLKNNHYCGFYQ